MCDNFDIADVVDMQATASTTSSDLPEQGEQSASIEIGSSSQASTSSTDFSEQGEPVSAPTSQIGSASTSRNNVRRVPNATSSQPNGLASRRAISNRRDSSDDFDLNSSRPYRSSSPTVPSSTTTATNHFTMPTAAHNDNSALCITCCDALRSVKLVPCTHCVYCRACYEKSCAASMKQYQIDLNTWSASRRRPPEPKLEVKCPICKQLVTETSGVILS